MNETTTKKFTLFRLEENANVRTVQLPDSIVQRYEEVCGTLTDEEASALLIAVGCDGRNNSSYTDDALAQKLCTLLSEEIGVAGDVSATVTGAFEERAKSEKIC